MIVIVVYFFCSVLFVGKLLCLGFGSWSMEVRYGMSIVFCVVVVSSCWVFVFLCLIRVFIIVCFVMRISLFFVVFVVVRC